MMNMQTFLIFELHFKVTKSSQNLQKSPMQNPENVEKYTFSLTFLEFNGKMYSGHKE